MQGESYQVDSIIDKCLEVRGARPGKLVKLEEKEILWLCAQSKELFLVQPNLLEREAPIKIVGDIHGNPDARTRHGVAHPSSPVPAGQYYDLLRLFEYGGFPPDSNYLFLG